MDNNGIFCSVQKICLARYVLVLLLHSKIQNIPGNIYFKKIVESKLTRFLKIRVLH